MQVQLTQSLNSITNIISIHKKRESFAGVKMLDIGKQNVIYFEGNKRVNVIGNVTIRGDLITITSDGGLMISIFKEKVVRMEGL